MSLRAQLVAISLLVGIVLSSLRAGAAPVSILCAYDVAVRRTGYPTVRVEAKPSLRFEPAGVREDLDDEAHDRYDDASNPLVVGGAGAAYAHDPALELAERRELGGGLEYGAAAVTKASGAGATAESAAVRAEATAAEAVGRRGAPMEIQPGRNAPGNIGGRDYTGHALDRMQGRGQTPSVVENTIQTGRASPGSSPGTTKYVDPGNGTTAVVDTATGRVVTVF